MLTQQDLEGLIGPIILKRYPDRRLHIPMSMEDLKPLGVTSMTYRGGNQVLHLGDKEIEISPMASMEEIKAAIANPFIKTENTKVTMASPLQGVGQKLGLLKHSAEQHAVKISARVDALSIRMDSAASKSMQALDAQEKDVVDVENFVADLENNNGGPA